jgi:hypothetical protein
MPSDESSIQSPEFGAIRPPPPLLRGGPHRRGYHRRVHRARTMQRMFSSWTIRLAAFCAIIATVSGGYLFLATGSDKVSATNAQSAPEQSVEMIRPIRAAIAHIASTPTERSRLSRRRTSTPRSQAISPKCAWTGNKGEGFSSIERYKRGFECSPLPFRHLRPGASGATLPRTRMWRGIW